MIEQKQDRSVSMERANVIVLFTSLPVAIAQYVLFSAVHGGEQTAPTWHLLLLIAAMVAGIVVHEWIHGLSWMIWGRKPLSAIRFGFQWKTFTPYAHLKEPVEVNAYRLGAFMPGFVLGILVYILSLLQGDGNLLWFSLVHTAAAGGDWLILWLIRDVKRGRLVEDHPTQAGCYVLETGLE